MISIFVFLLFITATIILPAVHSTRCHHKLQNDSNCPVCSVASLAVDTANLAIRVVDVTTTVSNTPEIILSTPQTTGRNLPPARAPPVA